MIPLSDILEEFNQLWGIEFTDADMVVGFRRKSWHMASTALPCIGRMSRTPELDITERPWRP